MRLRLALVIGLTWLAASAGRAGPAAGPGQSLVAAYPRWLSGVEAGALVWRDGARMPLSDGVARKSFDQTLDHPDIDDMFAIPYLPGPPAGPPPLNHDPGRVRYEPLFLKMYGDCFKGQVKPRLRRVKWLGAETVEFTTVNGADRALEAVVAELKTLPPQFTRYLSPSSGTYNCRAIAGTSRISMHAYGAAIDINTRFTDYWRWAGADARVIPYRNRIPFEIARIFERHGFIWGGKWYHYDTMHFEYRPELLGQRALG